MQTSDASTPVPSNDAPRRSSRRGAPRTNRLLVWGVGTTVALVVLVAAFVGVAFYTDQPSFCASCHEMKPYVDAWAAGPHKGIWCVDCHVEPGYPARLAHKFSVVGEVVAHFKGDTTFPRAVVPAIASAHCSKCHASVNPELGSGFSHPEHASKGTCQVCHATAGHDVTQAALTSAGEFNGNVTRAAFATDIVTVGGGKADVKNHVTVVCTNCHDLAKTGCQVCHTPKHAARGACQQCHAAGPKWVFTHPTQAACETCHTPSAKHFKPASGKLTPCTQCHAQPGKAWTFKHPAKGADCTTCHAVPAKHFQPASGTLKPCSSCHTQPGVSWKFSHPGAGADCQSCHTPPSGHSAGQCSQCHHKTGVSFAFAHPSTSMPGWQSMACAKCHPSGYTTHSCTCHGGGNGN